MIAIKVAAEIKQYETILKALKSLYNIQEINTHIEEVKSKMLELENLFLKYAPGKCKLTGIINEEWRSISGYMNYQVSNIGRVRNIITEHILKPITRPLGYLCVSLSRNKIAKKYLVHRLVAIEFLENPLDLPNVDHIDHNPSNNCFNNLRWCNQTQNNMNSIKNAKASSKFKGVSYNKRRNLWQVYINKYGTRFNLGFFKDEIAAARAYNKKAIELFGEFKLLNEIPG